MRLAGLLTAALVPWTASVFSAAAATPRHEIRSVVEAWYTTPAVEPACAVPVCTPPPEPVPSAPPPTLHVGMASGVQTDRAFVVLDVSSLDRRRIIGGQLSLPLAMPPIGADAAADPALMACSVYGVVTPANGTPGPGPRFDCSSSARVRFVPPGASESGDGQLVVDLNAFAAAWATGEVAALAIVPGVPNAESATPTWRFALKGRSDASAPSPIVATVEIGAAPDVDGTEEPDVDDQLATVAPDVTDQFVLVAPLMPALDAAMQAGAEEPNARGLVDTGHTFEAATRGFEYPAVLTLPLLLLLLGVSLGKTLTSEMPRLVGEPDSTVERLLDGALVVTAPPQTIV